MIQRRDELRLSRSYHARGTLDRRHVTRTPPRGALERTHAARPGTRPPAGGEGQRGLAVMVCMCDFFFFFVFV